MTFLGNSRQDSVPVTEMEIHRPGQEKEKEKEREMVSGHWRQLSNSHAVLFLLSGTLGSQELLAVLEPREPERGRESAIWGADRSQRINP